MPKTRANGIDIEYETFGKSENRPLVLIMGIGSQMVSWPLSKQVESLTHHTGFPIWQRILWA